MAYDWRTGGAGAAGGALQGAALGSSFLPGPGTAIGAILGAGAGLLGGIGGKKARYERPKMNPLEEQAYQQSLQQGLGLLQDPYKGFDPIARRAQSVFNQYNIPGMNEGFTDFTGGALSSPALGAQQSFAQLDLAERLAALQAQYGMQNQQSALQMLQFGMSPYQNQFYRPQQHGFGPQLFEAGMNSLPLIAESFKGQNLSENWQNFWNRKRSPQGFDTRSMH